MGYRNGGFEEAAWNGRCGATLADATRGIPLINRMVSSTMLQEGLGADRAGQCACLNPLWREGHWRESMRFHAPHLHNLWDLQLLLDATATTGQTQTNVIRAGGRPLWPSDEPSSPTSLQEMFDPSATFKMTFAQNWTEECCCKPPLNETGAELSWTVSMWARMCRLAERGGRQR